MTHRFSDISLGRRVAYRTHEFLRNLSLTVWRPYYRLCRFITRYRPVALIMGGTDCDGMRWASCSYHYTRRGAEALADETYAWVDGPTSHEVLTSRQGRKWESEYEPDTRDRFAERMGY